MGNPDAAPPADHREPRGPDNDEPAEGEVPKARPLPRHPGHQHRRRPNMGARHAPRGVPGEGPSELRV